MDYSKINFTDQDQMSGTQFKFENIGDSLVGTYVGKKDGVQTQFGETTVLRFMNDEGVWSVFPNGVLLDQMLMIKPGQIVKIVLSGTKPSGKGNPTKLYTVFARPNLVNEDWLKSHATDINPSDEEVNTDGYTKDTMFKDEKDEINVDNMNFGGNQDGVIPHIETIPAQPQTAPTPVAPAQTPSADDYSTDDKKKSYIQQLAREKLGVPMGEDCVVPVMEFCRVAFIPANYDEIIKILTQ